LLTSDNPSRFTYTKMSELVWDIKNGELDSVKNEIENKVNPSLPFSLFI